MYDDEEFDDSIEGKDDLVETDDDKDIYQESYDDFLFDEINGEYKKQDIMRKLGKKKLSKEELEFIMIHNDY